LLFSTSVFSLFIARRQYTILEKQPYAIIMADEVKVKSSPDVSGKEIFLLHEGTKVQVIETLGSWIEIKLPNNNIGWMPAADLENI
jgi:hypothetical protein